MPSILSMLGRTAQPRVVFDTENVREITFAMSVIPERRRRHQGKAA